MGQKVAVQAGHPLQQRSTTMQDPKDSIPQASRREPWNKGKLTGAKPPLRPKHVWSIRSKLQIEQRMRDLAMFNLAIDSKSERLRRRPPEGGRCGAARTCRRSR